MNFCSYNVTRYAFLPDLLIFGPMLPRALLSLVLQLWDAVKDQMVENRYVYLTVILRTRVVYELLRVSAIAHIRRE